jgi:hypothetical protein
MVIKPSEVARVTDLATDNPQQMDIIREGALDDP